MMEKGTNKRKKNVGDNSRRRRNQAKGRKNYRIDRER